MSPRPRSAPSAVVCSPSSIWKDASARNICAASTTVAGSVVIAPATRSPNATSTTAATPSHAIDSPSAAPAMVRTRAPSPAPWAWATRTVTAPAMPSGTM
ncbi:MAG: hypothetical protein MUF73_13370 [Rhodobacteraceae bacterium]|nr:hypothetical protein [Paracoccaceae bacterium]